MTFNMKREHAKVVWAIQVRLYIVKGMLKK